MVEVEASLRSDSGLPIHPRLFAALEGITMEPVGESSEDCTHAPRICDLRTKFVLDLDELPGLAGLPLTVTLTGGDTFGQGGRYWARVVMTVRMVRR
jgi:hypothetical protein